MDGHGERDGYGCTPTLATHVGNTLALKLMSAGALASKHKPVLPGGALSREFVCQELEADGQ